MTTATTLDVARRLAEQAQMLADQKRRLERLCARNVPGAWQVYDAIHGERREGGGRR